MVDQAVGYRRWCKVAPTRRVSVGRSVRPSSSARLGVLPDARSKVHHDAGLVAYHPGVMTGCRHHDIARSDLSLGAVVHPNTHPIRQDIARMRCLTGLGLGNRLNVLGPAPAGLEDAPPNNHA